MQSRLGDRVGRRTVWTSENYKYRLAPIDRRATERLQKHAENYHNLCKLPQSLKLQTFERRWSHRRCKRNLQHLHSIYWNWLESRLRLFFLKALAATLFKRCKWMMSSLHLSSRLNPQHYLSWINTKIYDHSLLLYKISSGLRTRFEWVLWLADTRASSSSVHSVNWIRN